MDPDQIASSQASSVFSKRINKGFIRTEAIFVRIDQGIHELVVLGHKS